VRTGGERTLSSSSIGSAWRLTLVQIGNGTIADVVVVWARDTADGRVKGGAAVRTAPASRNSARATQTISQPDQ